MTPLPKNKAQQLAFRRNLRRGFSAPVARKFAVQGRKFLKKSS